ncbi:MAG: hypothetical protein L7S58_05805 [Acidimicrobiales bacterium]|nr:hypothetical protein [Acidimicrobiales bacterium]
MEASSNQPPPPSKQQQQLYVADGSAWLPKGPMCLTCLISLFFAVLTLIVFFLVGSFVSDDGTDGIILVGLATSLCYLVSLVTGVIGRRRVKRDPDLKGNKFNTLYLTLLTIMNLGNTWFVLFIWVYVLPGELNGGCC